MQILPAIDIKDGQAVRLFKGDFNQQTVVNPDVIEQAKIFKDAGIQFIHVVDLDGALDGRATNRDLIAEVKKVSGLGIEVGGGIRTLEQIRDYLEVGIDRIIIGSTTPLYTLQLRTGILRQGILYMHGTICTLAFIHSLLYAYGSLGTNYQKHTPHVCQSILSWRLLYRSGWLGVLYRGIL